MHDIEPHFRWRDLYIASEDDRSPFFRRRYSEFDYSHSLYNFYLHPQWDDFGSSTLYGKILFTDYDEGFTLIELIGEWNDTLHNDIMYLKRNIVDVLMGQGISKFTFFCEHVLNFHGSDDDYYAEWWEEVNDAGGWVVLLNTRQHVEEELEDSRLDNYMHFGEHFNDVNWRIHKPAVVLFMVESLLQTEEKRLHG
jgi:hypothetical protein